MLGIRAADLARLFDVTPSAIRAAAEGRTHAHVPDPRTSPTGYWPRFSADGRRVLPESERENELDDVSDAVVVA